MILSHGFWFGLWLGTWEVIFDTSSHFVGEDRHHDLNLNHIWASKILFVVIINKTKMAASASSCVSETVCPRIGLKAYTTCDTLRTLNWWCHFCSKYPALQQTYHHWRNHCIIGTPNHTVVYSQYTRVNWARTSICTHPLVRFDTFCF